MFSLRILVFGFVSFFITSIAFADFGCHFIISRNNSIPLDRADKKISMKFTCQEDIVLSSVAVVCASAVHSPAYFISIREDRGGKPSPTSLKSSKCFIPKAGAWMTVPLDGVGMKKSRIYHIVVEYDPNYGGGHPVAREIGADHYAAFLSTSPLNKVRVRDESPDPAANVLVCKKSRWKKLNQQPLFAVYGRGFSSHQGNPYDVEGGLPVHGNATLDVPDDDVLQGQVLHFYCDFVPKGFKVRVKKIGKPTSPLVYHVYSHEYLINKTTEMYSGRALSPRDVSADWAWFTFDVPPYFPFKPHCFYIGFQTSSGVPDGDSCRDCYQISYVGNSGGLAAAMDLTYDGGPHLSRASTSYDGGKHWSDDFSKDLNFVVLGVPCPVSSTVPVQLSPTIEHGH